MYETRQALFCAAALIVVCGFLGGGTPARAGAGLDIKEGPYLQWVTRDAMTVMWETTAAADSTVFYRSGGDWMEASRPGAVRIHEIRLRGFAPQSTVEYYVRSRADADEVTSATLPFRTTPPGPAPFRFVVWGDNQSNPAVFSRLVRGMVESDPDLALAVGDVVESGDVYAQWGERFLTPLKPLVKFVPFFVAIGNHEQNSHWFYDYLAQPGNEHWFSFDYAGCHFVVIDTNYPFAPGSTQYRWLEAELFSEAVQESDWLFTFHHHPPYSEIYEEVKYAQVRSHLVPLFESAGVDVNLTGHIHDYERGIYVPPATGRRIAYIQTSGGGGRLWEDEFDGEWDQIEKVIQYVHHFCEVEVTRERLILRAIDTDGRTIDSILLEAMPRGGEPPPPPPPPGDAAVSQWDFTAGNLDTTYGPGALAYADGPGGETAAQTSFGTTTFFDIPPIAGEEARVMRFPRAATPAVGFRLEHGAPPNGGGTYVNEYTMVFDLYIPSSSFAADSWLGLYNTNASNSNDGEAFVRFPDGGIGISGQYDGQVQPNTWHRIALVAALDGGQPTLHKYIDGVEVGSQRIGDVDGRWSLYSRSDGTPWFFLLTDDNGDASSGHLSSFLFADEALGAREIEELGGPDADGILDRPETDPVFVRADPNSDGQVDISDAIALLVHLFVGGAPGLTCERSADVDQSDSLDITDPVYLLNYLFRGGPEPGTPFPDCSSAQTESSLSCKSYPPCEA